MLRKNAQSDGTVTIFPVVEWTENMKALLGGNRKTDKRLPRKQRHHELIGSNLCY